MNGAGFDDFQALSRRYWQAWSDGLRGDTTLPGFDLGQTAPWRAAMDAWVKSGLVSQHDMDAALGQFTRLSSDWLGRMQELAAQFANRSGTAAEIAEAWRAMLGAGGGNAVPQLSDMIAQMPGAQWWQGTGEAWLKAMQARPSALLELPAIGFTREHGERAQALVQAQLDLQQRVSDWQSQLQQSTQDAIARFERKLNEHAAPGKQITSVRGLFDVWVDAAEEAYAEMALSREYRTVYGALTDAQMRLRSSAQAIAEQAAKATGMPSRDELDGAHRKIAELERQVRRMRTDPQPRRAARNTPSEPSTADDAPPARAKRKPAPRKAAASAARQARSAAPAKAATATRPKQAKPAAPKARKKAANKAAKATRAALPDIRTPGVIVEPATGGKGSKRR